MREDFVENNEDLLQKIKDGEIPEDVIPIAMGSFFMCVFHKDSVDAIPLFFDFLAFKTNRDYCEEKKIVEECMGKGKEGYEKYVERNPLLMLLRAMCDD